MTERRSKGITDQEFEHLVDGEFSESLIPTRKNKRQHMCLPEKLLNELEVDGAAPGLSRSAARFNGAMRRIFGTKGPTNEKGIELLKELDSSMMEFARKHKLDVVD